MAPYFAASLLWCSKNEMPCSTSRANLSDFNSLRVILDTKTSGCYWKSHLTTRQAGLVGRSGYRSATAHCPQSMSRRALREGARQLEWNFVTRILLTLLLAVAASAQTRPNGLY